MRILRVVKNRIYLLYVESLNPMIYDNISMDVYRNVLVPHLCTEALRNMNILETILLVFLVPNQSSIVYKYRTYIGTLIYPERSRIHSSIKMSL